MCGTTPGSKETYQEQVCMPLNGKVVCIDKCIHQIVASLNAGGVRTRACCCGHGSDTGLISLEDGREIVIYKSADDINKTEDVIQLSNVIKVLEHYCDDMPSDKWECMQYDLKHSTEVPTTPVKTKDD